MSSAVTKVAFLGLGVMGAPMAGHLAAAGLAVTVYNRSADKADRWAAAHGGQVAATPDGAVHEAEIVCLCLGDDPDVEAVAGLILPAMAKDAILVDHTTASPALAKRLAATAAQGGVGFVDAPVSGGQAGAEAGKLSIMCGGAEDDIARARLVMAAYAARIVHVGPSGHGQLCKAVNQIAIAGLLEGLAEALHFAQCAGLDLDKTFEAVSGGAARSWQMENRFKTMAEDEFDFGFAVDWMRKDLRIALAEARANGAKLPVTALVDQFYAEVQALGGGRWDTSSLARRLQR